MDGRGLECPEDVGRVNALNGRGSQRVWGPEWLYFGAPRGGRQKIRRDEREGGTRGLLGRPFQGALQDAGREEGARDISRDTSPGAIQDAGREGAQTGVLRSAPPSFQGSQGRDCETCGGRDLGELLAGIARGTLLTGRVHFIALTSAIHKNGPATRVQTLQLPGLPECSLGVGQAREGQFHIPLCCLGLGRRRVVEGRLCEPVCLTLGWHGKHRLPEGDLVPGGQELDPKPWLSRQSWLGSVSGTLRSAKASTSGSPGTTLLGPQAGSSLEG